MSFPDRRTLNALLRVVLVDGKYFEPLQETEVYESIEWEDFLQVLYNMTVPVMSSIVRFVAPRPAGEGLSIDDGDWWYRIVIPINHATNFATHMSNQDALYPVDSNKGEWKFLNCQIGFRHMMDQIYYGHRMSDAFIEVQHQLQKDTVDLEQQLEDAAEQDMMQDMDMQVQTEYQRQAGAQIQADFRAYYDQLARVPNHPAFAQPAFNPYFSQHDQFQLQYHARNRPYQPQTKAEVEADQIAAMAVAAGFSFARDLPAEPTTRYQPVDTGVPPANVQARRRFLGGHAKSKRKEVEREAEEMEVEEVEVKKERKRKRLVDVAEEETEEKEREEKKKAQAAARAARAARRSGGV